MEVAQVCHKASFASQSILPRRIEKGCVQSVRVQGPPGGTLQTMIGEMAISTAREKGHRGNGIPWGSVCGSHHLVENTQHVFPHDLGHILTRVSSLQERLSDILIFTCVFDPLDIDRVASPV